MADVQTAPNLPRQDLDIGTQTGTKKKTSTLQAQVEQPEAEIEGAKKKVDDSQLEERLPEPEADVPEEVSKTKGTVEDTANSAEKPDLENSAEAPSTDDVKDRSDAVTEGVKDKTEPVTEQLTNGDDPKDLASKPTDETPNVDTPEVPGEVKDATEPATERLTNGEDVKDLPEGATKDVDEKAQEGSSDLKDKAECTAKDVKDKGEEAVGDVKDKTEDTTTGVEDKGQEVVGDLKDKTDETDDTTKDVEGKGQETTGDLQEKTDEAQVPDTEEATSDLKDKVDEAKPTDVDAQEKLDEVKPTDIDAQEKLDEVEPTDVDAKEKLDEVKPTDVDAQEKLDEAQPTDVDAKEKIDEATPEDAKVDVPEDVEAPEVPDLSILKNKKVNKLGKIVDENGNPFGQLIEGDPKKLFGKKVDAEGQIWDDSGRVIGRAELLPDTERENEPTAPFEDFPDSIVEKSGNVIFEGKVVGRLTEGDAKKLAGKKVDADGDILDKNGNVLGKAERYEEEEPEPEPEPEKEDLSILEGKKVNKAGNVVDDNGKLFGRIIEGVLARLVGKKTDKEGKIWSESGKVIGRAELIPVDDRDQTSGAPFEDYPDAIVGKDGKVTFEGVVVGRLIEGDAKKLVGKKVDQDGEVVDKIGNVLGKAERWEEEEVPEPEPEVADLSALAGKRVNKLGYVVDSNGGIFGRLVSGDPRKLAGKMCDKNGDIWNDGGVVVGKAELVPDADRAGVKEGPFAGFDNPKIAKDGKVTDINGVVVGRLIEGDAKKLYGKSVDDDGDVLDANGNTLGKAERWEEEEKEIRRHPAAGRRVNKAGNVVDDNGDVIAKLTDGDILKCAGKEIDNDGDVVDSKGASLGHVTLLEDIPEPEAEPEPEPVVEEPKETPEEIEERKQLEMDKKLANQMAACISQSIDKITPILKMITDAVDAAERQPKEELDEQKLVDTVKPLIEQGAGILQEANGVIRGLDPDGRIQANAKGKSASREATPEEYRLAEVLKELTGSVTQTIEQAKKKIAGMPHAKKELNPLWGLLAEPLGQILAAVGLLLSGVLGLVGRLLSVLGLGGLLDNLLGGLGIKGILQGLGLGSLTKSLTGKK